MDIADPERDFDIRYDYDQGGNRVKKTQVVPDGPDIETTYAYDINNVGTFGSDNNRLMFAETYDTSGEMAVLLETTWYYYTLAGNVERVVTRTEDADPADPEYSAVRLGYARNAQAVIYVLGETWNTDEQENPSDYTVTFAREFRHDGARERYMNRELDPVAVTNGDFTTYLSVTWSDFDGNSVYGDFTVEGTVLTELRSYEPGLAQVDTWTSSGSALTRYLHSDLIETLRQSTDSSGATDALRVMTAFGEPVVGPTERFGYAGAWGYQTHTDFPFLHVGHRYYDPSTGRFLQRDPIGIEGGSDVYAYVDSSPTGVVDPTGLFSSLNHPEAALVLADLAALGYTWGTHASVRAASRHVSLPQVLQTIQGALRTGRVYWDPVNNTLVYIYNHVTVCSNPWTGKITTVWPGERVSGKLRQILLLLAGSAY